MGLIQKRGVFKVTAKGKIKGKQWEIFKPIYEELGLLLALIAASVAMLATRGFANLDAQLWVLMLTLQSLPYWSSLICQLISEKKDKA